MPLKSKRAANQAGQVRRTYTVLLPESTPCIQVVSAEVRNRFIAAAQLTTVKDDARWLRERMRVSPEKMMSRITR